ncbi:heme/copper-type cytochrome/quinol oxidase subunit 2 [Streptomyces glaucescens]
MAADTEQFRRDGHRVEKWSIGWMVLSLALWVWLGYRLLMDNDQEFGRHPDDSHTLVGILALAVIPTIIAAATAVYSRVLFRLARQAKRS